MEGGKRWRGRRKLVKERKKEREIWRKEGGEKER